jgi:hypothetical protein
MQSGIYLLILLINSSILHLISFLVTIELKHLKTSNYYENIGENNWLPGKSYISTGVSLRLRKKAGNTT